jgi:hypothetical protein
MLMHPDDKLRRTWAFVMTLCFSRHQYVEFVWDQSVATRLGCHRRAFEWFAAVPNRVIIDNAKCAITKACAKDPTVQRAYASSQQKSDRPQGVQIMQFRHCFSRATASIQRFLRAIILATFGLSTVYPSFAVDLVAYTEEWAPYNYAESTAAKGISTDILREACALAKRVCEIHLVPWARAYKMASSTPNTLAFTMARTPEREKEFLWIDRSCRALLGSTSEPIRQADSPISNG